MDENQLSDILPGLVQAAQTLGLEILSEEDFYFHVSLPDVDLLLCQECRDNALNPPSEENKCTHEGGEESFTCADLSFEMRRYIPDRLWDWRIRSSDDTHPHIPNGGGSMCVSDRSMDSIRHFLDKNLFVEALQTAIDITESWNKTGAYHPLGGYPHCDNCEREIDEDDRTFCSNCDTEICYGCRVECRACDNYFCSNCCQTFCDSCTDTHFECYYCNATEDINDRRTCVECERDFCDRHAETCEYCEEQVCASCIQHYEHTACLPCGREDCKEKNVFFCRLCGKAWCEDHTSQCSVCKADCCPECQIDLCGFHLREQKCAYCPRRHIARCAECGQKLCSSHVRACSCGERICVAHPHTPCMIERFLKEENPYEVEEDGWNVDTGETNSGEANPCDSLIAAQTHIAA